MGRLAKYEYVTIFCLLRELGDFLSDYGKYGWRAISIQTYGGWDHADERWLIVMEKELMEHSAEAKSNWPQYKNLEVA